MVTDKHFISIIVPVFNQWHLVSDLIECLKVQSVSAESFELVLVDNGSAPVPRLPDISDWPSFAKMFKCMTPGSYAARNHGISNACGKLLAFTDADCRPEADWLRSLASALGNNEKLIVAGKVRIEADEPVSRAARYDMAMGFPQERYVARGYGVTANLAMSRALFERLGGFDVARFSGGDAEFCRRAVSHGAKLVYSSEAVVVHPARRSVDELIRKVRRVKGGQIRNGPLLRRMQYAVRAFLPPIRAWWRIWRSDILEQDERFSMVMLQGRLWIAGVVETMRLLLGGKPERR